VSGRRREVYGEIEKRESNREEGGERELKIERH